MQPDCSIHLLSFRNWRPTGSFWRIMVNFRCLSRFALLTWEVPFCGCLPVVEDIKKGLFLKLLFQGWNLYVFVLFIQKNPHLIKSYWENEWQKSFSFKSTMHINAHQVWTHTIPFAHGQVVRPPNFSPDAIPETSFTCEDKITGGYYADLEADCQLFHVCVQVSEYEVRKI